MEIGAVANKAIIDILMVESNGRMIFVRSEGVMSASVFGRNFSVKIILGPHYTTKKFNEKLPEPKVYKHSNFFYILPGSYQKTKCLPVKSR